MKGKKFLAALLAVSFLPLQTYAAMAAENTVEWEYLNIPVETTLAKSELGNPFLGFDENGDVLYGGDPSILVDGDTVYAYVGHDASTYDWYNMPDYRVYSSRDLIHWEYENMIMEMTQVSWALDDVTAWASQTIKFKGKYYLLFCTTSNIAGESEGHCIGVAECDTATGDFIPMDEPLILNSQTGIGEDWYDLDPTAWIDKDAEGNDETLYIGWGNTEAYVCQADVDENGHLYVIDQNDNGVVSKDDGDIVQFTFNGNPSTAGFTEGSYFYRQQDENGNYYGDYYVFYAAGWREQMAYSTTDDLMSGQLEYGGIVMPPSTTCGTNHPAVFDFKGGTYFTYHTGALPWGSGARRCVCMEEFSINEDGTIDEILMTSTGLSGVTTRIFDSAGVPIAHEAYVNPLSDAAYPMVKEVMLSADAEAEDAAWELEKGKADGDNEAYVSIQSYNKPGLYLCANETDIILAQDTKKDDTETQANMTFRTLKGMSGTGITFESVAMPGYYLTSENGDLILSDAPLPEMCTFRVETDTKALALEVMKTKRLYTVGSELKTDDIRVTVCHENGDNIQTADFTTNAEAIDMNTVGEKSLIVTYMDGDTPVKETVPIRVVEESKTTGVDAVQTTSLFENLNAEVMEADAAVEPVKEFTFENSLNGAAMQLLHNDDTYTGNAIYEDGKYGDAIRLGDYGLKLNVGAVGENYSVSMWVNPSSAVANYSSLLFLGTPKGATELWASLTGDGNGGLRLWSTGDGYAWETAFSGVILPVNTWSLVTLTQEGNHVTLYINGEEKASGSAARPLMDSGNDIYIGANHWDALYQGLVDEIAVYDKALSPTEVAELAVDRAPETVLADVGFQVEEALYTYTGISSLLLVDLPMGVESSDATIQYASDNASVAMIDENGMLIGMSAGTATITTSVTVGSVTKTANTVVTVSDISEITGLPVVAQYDMAETDGNVIVDASGKGNDAAIVNPDGAAYVKDGDRTVLQITDTGSYITLPSGIYTSLTDKEVFTIEATYARSEQDAFTAWLFCIGSKAAGVGSNYLFYSPFFGENIRAGIKDASTEMLYDASRTLLTDTYYTISMVFNQGTITLYIDGIQAGPALESGMSMESIVNNGTADGILGYIGKSCWSGDGNLLGKIDSFKIYDKALTESEVQLSNAGNAEVLKAQLDAALTEEMILGEYNDSLENVSYNLNLINSLGDWDVSWVSSNPEVVTKEGLVTNPETDTEVTLTAYVCQGLMTAEKTFTVTAKPMDLSEVGAMLEEAKALDCSVFTPESVTALTNLLDSLGEEPLSQITSQQKAHDLKYALITAVSGLICLDEYKEPWSAVAAVIPKEDAAYQAGDTEVLFTLPETLENDVTVTYHSDNEAVATYKDGKAEAVAAGTAILTVTVTAKVDGFAMEYSTCVTVEDATDGLPYVDVAKGDWYYDAVNYAYTRGLMTGLTDTAFGPVETLSRAQLALILYRIEGSPEVTYSDIFSDVADDQWYTSAVLWAQANGIVTGYGDTGMFGPHDKISREQMAVMMHRYAAYKNYDTSAATDFDTFTDASSVSAYAETAMKWAVGNSIITGKSAGTLMDPQGDTLRAECATIIMRFMEKYNK